MDKAWTKHVCVATGIPTADWVEIAPGATDAVVLAHARELGFPLVFKPVHEGSAVGVHIPRSAAELEAALTALGPRTVPWMLEAYIPGRELTVPWLWGSAFPIVEIRPKQGFYDYTNKYTQGASEYHCPADLSAEVAARVADAGNRLAVALRLRDMARIDVRLSDEGTPYVLEANTIPGMTAVSLLPMGAKAKGIDFPTMCDRLVRAAADRDPRRPT